MARILVAYESQAQGVRAAVDVQRVSWRVGESAGVAMTDERTLRIEKELQKSSRWRANRQPALDVVLEYLTEHGWPVEHVWMVKDDEMIVALSRMLTIACDQLLSALQNI